MTAIRNTADNTTTLTLPRQGADDMALIIRVDPARGYVTAAIDRTKSSDLSLAFAMSADISVRSSPTHAALHVGATLFNLRPPEAEAVRDLLHAHAIPFADAREAA